MTERISALLAEGFSYAQVFDPRRGTDLEYGKVQVRPFRQGEKLACQLTYVCPRRVYHENIPLEDLAGRLTELLEKSFSQCLIRGARHDYHLTALGRLKVRVSPPSAPMEAPGSHNREKDYLLKEGTPVPFLVRLGVMTPEGRVVKGRYDKFKQLNKYLELISGCVDALPRDRAVKIVDFGCGKAYLTFALYHELVVRRGLRAEIAGLDLKEDVIDFCTQVALDLGFEGLRFCKGEIKDFAPEGNVDMVVTLHACDTATDDALVQALKWQAKVILLVPCCQHEFFPQLKCDVQRPVLKHGILRERQAALLTDAVRAQLLEACGRRVKVMEFISLEHTPKNLLIQALSGGAYNRRAYEEYRALARTWGVRPYLERRLREEGLLPGEWREEEETR